MPAPGLVCRKGRDDPNWQSPCPALQTRCQSILLASADRNVFTSVAPGGRDPGAYGRPEVA